PTLAWPQGVSDVSARFVESGGMKWRVCTAGPASGRPVLLVHGWGANAYMYRAMIPPLAAAGYCLVIPDLPGHGWGDLVLDRRQAHLGAYVTALRTLCDTLGVERMAMVGQSMGGGNALQFALDHPERVAALALVSPVGYTIPKAVTLGRAVMPRAARTIFPWLARRAAFALALRASYGRLGVPTAADIDQYFAPTRDPAFARALHTLLHELEWNACDDGRARALRVPTVVICGDADRLVNRRTADCFARDVPHARIHRVHGGGHTLAEEVPAFVSSAIVSVLREVY
ncbi:MAG: alpha/beta hydrolase, partial [Gemmatimonadota bacterium]|nr:alpha/beta hydrolase [Gemmatimonadota bacterium]